MQKPLIVLREIKTGLGHRYDFYLFFRIVLKLSSCNGMVIVPIFTGFVGNTVILYPRKRRISPELIIRIMKGPFKLDTPVIDSIVKSKRPGAMILGKLVNDNFIARLMNLSGNDLNAALKRYIGSHEHFYYEYADDAADAYYRLCNFYHIYNGKRLKVGNHIHPEKPQGWSIECPVCGK